MQRLGETQPSCPDILARYGIVFLLLVSKWSEVWTFWEESFRKGEASDRNRLQKQERPVESAPG